jgi:hypothetical protein
MRYLKLFEQFNEVESFLPEFWYHGSNEDFNKFDMKYARKNYDSSILGIYFTEYLNPPPYGSTAVEYAKRHSDEKGGKPIIYKCKIKLDNPLFIDSHGHYNSNAIVDMHREKLLRQRDAGNHDGIIIYNSDYNKIPDYITDENISKKEYGDFILVTHHIEKIKIIEKMTIK